jgi:hypothetical protein
MWSELIDGDRLSREKIDAVAAGTGRYLAEESKTRRFQCEHQIIHPRFRLRSTLPCAAAYQTAPKTIELHAYTLWGRSAHRNGSRKRRGFSMRRFRQEG